MIRLTENKSQIWFKLLTADHQAIDGSMELWNLPSTHNKGARTTFEGACKVLNESEAGWQDHPEHQGAAWLVSDPSKLYIPDRGYRIYVVQIWNTPLFEIPSMIWVKEASLLRQATHLDLKPFQIHEKAFL